MRFSIFLCIVTQTEILLSLHLNPKFFSIHDRCYNLSLLELTIDDNIPLKFYPKFTFELCNMHLWHLYDIFPSKDCGVFIQYCTVLSCVYLIFTPIIWNINQPFCQINVPCISIYSCIIVIQSANDLFIFL